MGKKTKAARPSKVKLSEKECLAKAARQVVSVGLAGAILESVAEFLCTNRAGSPLKVVIADAERRLAQSEWRKKIERIL